ncbi:unnamed protein product [Heterobilharzia americana]|nr:unnamed protein product [Heterobilharzia americana]
MRSAICVAVRYLFLAVYCGWNIRITLQDNQTTVMSHLDSTETANKNQTIVVEALWDETSKNQTQVTVHAGESIIFVCRIWTSSSGVQHISNSETHITEQSVFLFCPMSVAYCAQDCLLVDSKWPFQCTRQF